MPLASLKKGCVPLVASLGLAVHCLAQVEEIPLAPSSAIGRTVSSSKQFQIYSEDSKTRAAFATFVENVKLEFLAMLGQRDHWVTPIIMKASGRLAGLSSEVPLSQEIVFEKESGKLQYLELQVRLGTNFSREELWKLLIQMLAFEMASRDAAREVTPDLLPVWLREGLPGTVRFQRDGKPSALFASIFKSGQVLSAADLLAATNIPRDSVSRAVFEASAAGFVKMLLSQPSGLQKTAEFIQGLSGTRNVTMSGQLASHFPGLRGKPEHLEKEWALFVSSLAKPRALEFLSAEATEAGLEDALKVSYLEYKEEVKSRKPPADERKKPRLRLDFWRKKAKKGDVEPVSAPAQPEAKPTDTSEEKTQETEAASETRTVDALVTDFTKFLRRKDRATIVGQSLSKLDELSTRAYPIYVSLIEDYKTVLRKLAKGEVNGAEKKLKSLGEERAQWKTSLGKISDYLDWHEVTQMHEKSGSFAEFLRRSKQIEESVTRREDQISQYLDTLERAMR